MKKCENTEGVSFEQLMKKGLLRQLETATLFFKAIDSTLYDYLSTCIINQLPKFSTYQRAGIENLLFKSLCGHARMYLCQYFGKI